jgi:diacylglycerol kinase (ATP)
MEKLLILVDSAAGRGAAGRRLASLLRRRPFHRLRVRVADVAHRSRLLAALEPATGAVIAAGGDGTAAAVAASVIDDGRDLAMGVLPLGTGNAFAHSLGLGSTAAALAAIASGRARSIDVMRTDRPDAPVALVSISTGFEGVFVERYGRHRRWGRVTGACSGLVAAIARTSGVTLSADGRTLLEPGEAVFTVGLYNMRAYAGGLVPWPDADPADGRMSAVVVPQRRDYGRVLAGMGVTFVRAECSSAVLDTPVPLQMDGNVHPPGRLTIRVAAGALRVLAPVGHGTPAH